METKEQWLERIWGDLTMGGKLSKESGMYKAMMQQIDYYWDIQQTLEKAVKDGNKMYNDMTTKSWQGEE